MRIAYVVVMIIIAMPYFVSISDSSSLVPIPGCILTLILDPHPTLARAVHLFPPSVLVTLDDVIPGIVPTVIHEGKNMVRGRELCDVRTLAKISSWEIHF